VRAGAVVSFQRLETSAPAELHPNRTGAAMIMPRLPVWVVDVGGPILMILFTFLCLRLVFALRRRDPNNVIWTYLLWIFFGLAGFAVSRSAGHLVKDVLILAGKKPVWDTIRPFSGSINTFMLVVVSAVTLFFERIWKIYQQILKDQQVLQETHQKLIYLNQNLEQLVDARTHELALSEHKYRRIFEISKDMILMTDKAGAIVDVNPTGKMMLAVNGETTELVGSCLDEFLNPTQWTKITDEIRTKGGILNAEIDLIRHDGTTRRALLSGSLDRGKNESDDTIHYLVKDIEERRLMEQQIAQADKLASLGQLSAGVAHEINNPLGIILGYTQMLLREMPPGSQNAEDLKIIEKHVKTCKTIVKDLLNFARSSATSDKAYQIRVIIDDVLDFVQQHTDLEKHRIVREYDADTPAMLLDEKKIKQVFVNLILNAVHAVGDEGTINISTRYDAKKKTVSVKVRDDGQGVAQKHLPRIFDPFFTTKPTGEGTGLGLSVSYGIVKNHGGDITVKSAAGKGSTFTVRLPIRPEA
jgi:two-component system, NtrC family, sensor kinase